MLKIKFGFCSDIHIHPSGNPFPETLYEQSGDVLALVGDIVEIQSFEKFRVPEILNNFLEKWKEIIWVNGNHEYYGSDLRDADRIMRDKVESVDSRVRFLQNETFGYGGIQFFGSTFWTSMTSESDLETFIMRENVRQMMNDYIHIRINGRRINPHDIVEIHNESFDTLSELLTGPQRAVVLTHHAPSRKSVAKKFYGHSANPGYVSRYTMNEFKHKPTHWIHGHTHTQFDYVQNGVRVMCNPVGYPFERESIPQIKVIEL